MRCFAAAVAVVVLLGMIEMKGAESLASMQEEGEEEESPAPWNVSEGDIYFDSPLSTVQEAKEALKTMKDLSCGLCGPRCICELLVEEERRKLVSTERRSCFQLLSAGGCVKGLDMEDSFPCDPVCTGMLPKILSNAYDCSRKTPAGTSIFPGSSCVPRKREEEEEETEEG